MFFRDKMANGNYEGGRRGPMEGLWTTVIGKLTKDIYVILATIIFSACIIEGLRGEVNIYLLIFLAFMGILAFGVYLREKTPETDTSEPINKDLQINGSITVKCVESRLKPYKCLKIRKLIRSKEDKEDKKLNLKWETLEEGIKYLTEKIENSTGGGGRFDIFVGVNETGLMIASYLSAKLTSSIKPVGIIRSGGLVNGKREFKILLPDIKFDRTISIAIIDIEIKSGDSAERIVKKMKKKYRDKVEITFIALCGVLKEGDKGVTTGDINYFGWKIDNQEYKPDLIAFYVDYPGVKGPDGIR